MNFHKILLILGIGSVFTAISCKRETKDEKFWQDFQQFTQKECPKFVDPCTRLDSAFYDIDSRTICYYYTVQDALDIDSIYTDELKDAFRNNIQKGLKNSIPMKQYKDEGVTFRYTYRSITTGKTHLELTFTPEDYGK